MTHMSDYLGLDQDQTGNRFAATVPLLVSVAAVIVGGFLGVWLLSGWVGLLAGVFAAGVLSTIAYTAYSNRRDGGPRRPGTSQPPPA